MGNRGSVPEADVARPVAEGAVRRSDMASSGHSVGEGEEPLPLRGMVGSDGKLILSERGKESERKRREIEAKQRNGRPWIEPLDHETICRKRRELEAMSEAELKRELKHFGISQVEIWEESQDDTGTKMAFEEFKHKWVDLAIGAQILGFSGFPTQSDVIAAEALEKGEGCKEFLARAEALPRGEGVGGGKRKKSKKRKSKRKKSKRKKTRRRRR